MAMVAVGPLACGSGGDSGQGGGEPVGEAKAAVVGSIGTAAGFEDDDGNLTPEAPINFDWNSFTTTSWTGTAPYRTSSKTVSGWAFTGIEDAQVTTTDTAFAGGTKQDDDCASVGTGKASNKDDLKRAYVASKTVGGHVYLELGWVRIPQNTTSPSAHVAFEFNQNNGSNGTACPTGSDGLVKRSTANGGDMLIVYDFEGGTTDVPSIKLSRWIASGTCEVGSDSPPCWGVAQNLTTAGFAEAKVNTTATASDTISPSSPTADTLGLNEFGEAGIDLTAAGVFSENVCTGFGKVFAVSRSSGNSSQAQMKDLVGPANINISNCGQIIIRKTTVPSPDPTDTTFSYTTTGLTPSSFTLKNGGNKDFGNTVQAGSYGVTESDPGSNFTLSSIDCSASTLTNGSTVTTNTSTRAVSITLAAGDKIDCTFTNTLQQGAIKIHKTSSKDGSALAGAKFDIKSGGTTVGQVTTDGNGDACLDHLTFGDYTVTETAAPTNYAIDTTDPKTVTVSATGTCTSGTQATTSFTDTPLSQITVSFKSLVAGATTATIECTGDSQAESLPDGTPRVLDDLAPGTYTCTVVIDP